MSGAYCIAIHVPVYTDGSRTYAVSEWKRALDLLRDSFAGRFDRFIVVAPAIAAASAPAGTVLEPVGEGGDGFDVRPSLPHKGSKRSYWLGGERRRWKADVARALAEAEIAHTGLGDLYRPINKDALSLALARPVTTVFVRDTDEVTKFRDLIASGLMRPGPDREIYIRYYERVLRRAVAIADLSLLKGTALFERYGPGAKNPQMIQDTSYRSAEIVPGAMVEARIASAQAPGRPLRLVYCGRLVARKGLDHGIEIVARARAAGAAVTFDLIGSGEERAALEGQAARAGLSDAVRFLGERPYGPDLFHQLAEYDALFFTPLSEDTPRMIFDGYAAGLPLIGYDIPYVRERSALEKATILLPAGDREAAAARVAQAAGAPGEIAALARAAHRAAHDNATEVWYGRRAEWTLEAHARRVGA